MRHGSRGSNPARRQACGQKASATAFFRKRLVSRSVRCESGSVLSGDPQHARVVSGMSDTRCTGCSSSGLHAGKSRYLVTFTDRSTVIAEGSDSFDARHNAQRAECKSPVSADIITGD